MLKKFDISKRKVNNTSKIKNTKNNKANPKRWIFVSFKWLNLIFNSITTKIKITAIAPTYMITKISGKYSSSNKKSKQLVLKKHNIKKNTEWTGFLDKISMTEDSTKKTEKILKITKLKNIKTKKYLIQKK